MHVVALQTDIVWEDKTANYDRVREMLERREGSEPDLIVLPEMFATGFSMNAASIAEPADGPTRDFLGEIAVHCRAHVLAGMVSRGGSGKGRNDAVLMDPSGQEVVRYCKRHPFSYSGEPDHYEAGDDLVVTDLAGWRLCPLICYDLRFPEDFRAAVRQGANLFVVIANWPAAREHHWRSLLVARAIEDQAYVVGVNRCGKDPKLPYSGASMIIDPRGDTVADAKDPEGPVEAALDLGLLRDYREQFPALNDMRSD